MGVKKLLKMHHGALHPLSSSSLLAASQIDLVFQVVSASGLFFLLQLNLRFQAEDVSHMAD